MPWSIASKWTALVPFILVIPPPSLPHKYIYMDMEINKIHVCVMASQTYKIHTFNSKKINVKIPTKHLRKKRRQFIRRGSIFFTNAIVEIWSQSE